MDNQYDILAIAAGCDMIDAGSTKNIMNRGMLEWLKDTKIFAGDVEFSYGNNALTNWHNLTGEEQMN